MTLSIAGEVAQTDYIIILSSFSFLLFSFLAKRGGVHVLLRVELHPESAVWSLVVAVAVLQVITPCRRH